VCKECRGCNNNGLEESGNIMSALNVPSAYKGDKQEYLVERTKLRQVNASVSVECYNL